MPTAISRATVRAPIQTSYGYDSYGVTQTAGAASTNTFQFTGRENDGTGLYDYRNRYYNPAWGRFISEDPIGLAGGDVNLYRYVGNNPINYGDPSGNFFPIIIGGAAAAGAALEGIGWGAVIGGGTLATVYGLCYLFTGCGPTSSSPKQCAANAYCNNSAGGGSGQQSGGDEGGSKPTSGQIAQAEKVLEQNGPGAVEKAIRSIEKQIAEHEAKIASATGYTSSMERELRNFRQLLEAYKGALNK